MKRSTLTRAALPATVALGLALAGCSAANEPSPGGSSSSSDASGSSSSSASLSGNLNGAGATSQQAAQQAWNAGFNATNPDVQVNYDAQGSGAGVTQFTSGAVSFAGTDKALSDEELAAGKQACGGSDAVDLPVYVSPIALAYNLPGVSDLKLSPATAAKIFMGQIATWDDPAIAGENPGAQLPATRIVPVHRSDKSGTTNNFTDWLHQAAPDVWTAEAAETWPVQGGEAAQGTSGVVSAVKAAEGGIGYADASQVSDPLGAAQVIVGSGAVGPDAEAAAATLDASEQATGRPDGDITYEINRQPDSPDAYPVILVSYLVVCTNYPDQNTADLVKGYASYIVSTEGQDAAAKNAGSAPISDTLRTNVTKTLDSITSGS